VTGFDPCRSHVEQASLACPEFGYERVNRAFSQAAVGTIYSSIGGVILCTIYYVFRPEEERIKQWWWRGRFFFILLVATSCTAVGFLIALSNWCVLTSCVRGCLRDLEKAEPDDPSKQFCFCTSDDSKTPSMTAPSIRYLFRIQPTSCVPWCEIRECCLHLMAALLACDRYIQYFVVSLDHYCTDWYATDLSLVSARCLIAGATLGFLCFI
jgi:hypothetical protein